MLDRYVAQVRLLLSTLSHIAGETVFALKGGTAINLFYRDMPRPSVDIDLAYLPLGDRQSALKGIDDALGRIMTVVTGRNPRVSARRIAGSGNTDTRIMVSDGRAQIKIELSPVMRGTVYPVRSMIASGAVTEQFGFVETTVLAFEDLYGGKLHAALDRRHPRDLFDARLLHENEGLTADLFRTRRHDGRRHGQTRPQPGRKTARRRRLRRRARKPDAIRPTGGTSGARMAAAMPARPPPTARRGSVRDSWWPVPFEIRVVWAYRRASPSRRGTKE